MKISCIIFDFRLWVLMRQPLLRVGRIFSALGAIVIQQIKGLFPRRAIAMSATGATAIWRQRFARRAIVGTAGAAAIGR